MALKKTRGPEPDRLKIEGDWTGAVAKAMKKKKPASGWPKPEPMPQRSPKAKPAKK
jgi:hypothetical protein